MADFVPLCAPIQSFAQDMQRKLDANHIKSGWDESALLWLLRRLRQETNELEKALRDPDALPIDLIDEAADVGNFAMMIADQVKRGRK